MSRKKTARPHWARELDTVLDMLSRLDEGGFLRESEAISAHVRRLVTHRGVARRLVKDILGATGDQADPTAPAAHLLHLLLDEARRMAEDGKRRGEEFLEAADRAVAINAGDVTAAGASCLLVLYHRANLAPPPGLAPDYEEDVDEALEAQSPDEALGTPEELQEVLDAPPEVAHSLFLSLDEVGAGKPVEEQLDLVCALVTYNTPVCARLTLFWLLHQNAEVRRGVAELLHHQANDGALTPMVATRLPQIRNWLPDEPARRVLDKAIRQVQRQGLMHASAEPPPTSADFSATPPDGVGAVGLVMTRPTGAVPDSLGLAMSKIGHGLRDAYCIQPEAQEMQTILEGLESEAFRTPISESTARLLLESALAETTAAGHAAPPGLVDVVDQFPFAGLRPRPCQGLDWLTVLDPEDTLSTMSKQMRGRLINESRDWPDWLATTQFWFEDNDALAEAIIESTTSPRALEVALREALEPRRAFWAEVILRTGVVLQDTLSERARLGFAAVGAALLGDRALRDIPIMGIVAEQTLAAIEEMLLAENEEEEDEDMPWSLEPAPEEDPLTELTRVFGWDERAPDWIDGVLSAVAVKPDQKQPHRWMEWLLQAAPADAAQDSIGRFFHGLMQRMEELQETLGGPSPEPRLVLLPDDLPPEALQAWSRGFTDALDAGITAWGKRRPKRQDAQMIAVIRELAKGRSSVANPGPLIRDWLRQMLAGP